MIKNFSQQFLSSIFFIILLFTQLIAKDGILIVLYGPMSSGKSTVALELKKIIPNSYYLSQDEIICFFINRIMTKLSLEEKDSLINLISYVDGLAEDHLKKFDTCIENISSDNFADYYIFYIQLLIRRGYNVIIEGGYEEFNKKKLAVLTKNILVYAPLSSLLHRLRQFKIRRESINTIDTVRYKSSIELFWGYKLFFKQTDILMDSIMSLDPVEICNFMDQEEEALDFSENSDDYSFLHDLDYSSHDIDRLASDFKEHFNLNQNEPVLIVQRATYDMLINTENITPLEVAQAIKQRFFHI